MSGLTIEQALKTEAARQGFLLAGIATPDPPEHFPVFAAWLRRGQHGEMTYLATEQSIQRRADPRLSLPECQSILVLGIPYTPPSQGIGDKGKGNLGSPLSPLPSPLSGQVAAYAWGDDYHDVLPERLTALVTFLEGYLGHSVPYRGYTDTGPLLERDLAQRAGLGWIGKNTCLINPRQGSYFLLAEILLGIPLQPDAPFASDHCGTCSRCLDACPTGCILPDRTLDARRCLSYLTIELKGAIPADLRPSLGDWVFGCDICQQVCPWNRFALSQGDPAFAPREDVPTPDLLAELALTPEAFNRKFKGSPLRRAKRRGYLRNVAVALGNLGDMRAIPALERALDDLEPLVREHAAWALEQIER